MCPEHASSLELIALLAHALWQICDICRIQLGSQGYCRSFEEWKQLGKARPGIRYMLRAENQAKQEQTNALSAGCSTKGTILQATDNCNGVPHCPIFRSELPGCTATQGGRVNFWSAKCTQKLDRFSNWQVENLGCACFISQTEQARLTGHRGWLLS
jgi:hypothetical protein